MSDEPSTPASPGHPRPHVRRALLAASASIAALVMVVSAVGMGTYVWANGQRNRIGTDTVPVPSGSPQPDVADILGKCATHACNYLLLGSDSRQGLSAEEQ